ncbi:hypothetical protein T01_9640 [Trichinella spiralis]|uniref:Uncharacterized protein n=1 Tax=Trichinella spiralis TaxID=6334 RepID=A0A0V1B185_TRISP|nr:hypothetical protein T01_9640 [Trichinella spiralis]
MRNTSDDETDACIATMKIGKISPKHVIKEGLSFHIGSSEKSNSKKQELKSKPASSLNWKNIIPFNRSKIRHRFPPIAKDGICQFVYVYGVCTYGIWTNRKRERAASIEEEREGEGSGNQAERQTQEEIDLRNFLTIGWDGIVSINFRMIYIVDTDLKHNSIQMIEEKNNKNMLLIVIVELLS